MLCLIIIPAQPLPPFALRASNLVPGLVAEDHAEHHVHGGCEIVSRWSASLVRGFEDVPPLVAIKVA